MRLSGVVVLEGEGGGVILWIEGKSWEVRYAPCI